MLHHRSLGMSLKTAVFFILLFCVLLNRESASCKELYFTNQSVRALGMGGFYGPIVRDTDALFYNPAALGMISGIHWRVFSLDGGINTALLDSQGASAAGNNAAASGGGGTSINLTDFYGKNISLFTHGNTAIVIPYFGVAGYDDGHMTISVHNPPYPNVDMEFINDYGFIMGGAMSVGPTATLGMNVKQIRRWGGSNSLAIGTLIGGAVNTSSLTGMFTNKGVGYGIDLAALSTLPGTWSPSFSIVWHDIGTTVFAKTDGVDAPPRIEENLALGAAGVLDLPGFDFTAGVELTHLMQSSEAFGKKVHLGAEISLPFVDFRGGIGQGYTSYGVGLNLLLLKMDAAVYTTELGVYPGQTPDTRVQIGLTMDLGFDFNFNLLSLDMAKKRKLKVRR